MNERDIKDRLDNYSMTVPEGLKARTFESFQRRQAERRRRLGMASGAFVLSALAVLFFWANEERELKLTSSPERRILLSENQIEIPGFTKISNLKNLDYKTLVVLFNFVGLSIFCFVSSFSASYNFQSIAF